MPTRHTFDWWKDRLEGQVRTGDGFRAICPAHADEKPSLHITRKRTGPPVLHCFSGCTYDDIEQAARGGTTDDEVTPGPKVHKVRLSRQVRRKGSSSTDPLTWFAAYLGGIPLEFLQTLPLRAEGDNLLFTFPHNGIAKVRLASNEEKRFAWNKTGVATPYLWPMPDEAMPATIYLTEGETDCVILRYLSYPAYAITKGAGKKKNLPTSVYRALVASGVTHIVLTFDQDDAGEESTETFSDAIIDAGMSVSTLRPRLKVFQGETDIRDWFKRTGGKEPIEALSEVTAFDLDALALTAPGGTTWVTPGYFARDALTIVSGPPKSGKSTLMAHFLWCLEHGATFLGEPTRKGRALLMTEEFAPTILEKTDKFGIEDVAVLTQGHAAKQGWTFSEALTRAVSQARREKRGVLVIDTLAAWAQFNDENDSAEVTRALTTIRNAIADAGLAVILIHHTRKGGGEHGEAVRGSSALYASCEISLEYAHKDKSTRSAIVSSRFINVPEPLFVRMDARGNLEVVDQAEWNLEEAQPVIDALEAGPRSVQELMDATGHGDVTVRKHLRGLETLGKIEVQVGARGKKIYTLISSAIGGSGFRVRKVRK